MGQLRYASKTIMLSEHVHRWHTVLYNVIESRRYPLGPATADF